MNNLCEEQIAKISVVLLRKTACVASVGHLSDTKGRKSQENSRFSRFSDAEFHNLGKQKNSRISWGNNNITFIQEIERENDYDEMKELQFDI